MLRLLAGRPSAAGCGHWWWGIRCWAHSAGNCACKLQLHPLGPLSKAGDGVGAKEPEDPLWFCPSLQASGSCWWISGWRRGEPCKAPSSWWKGKAAWWQVRAGGAFCPVWLLPPCQAQGRVFANSRCRGSLPWRLQHQQIQLLDFLEAGQFWPDPAGFLKLTSAVQSAASMFTDSLPQAARFVTPLFAPGTFPMGSNRRSSQHTQRAPVGE